MIRTKRLYMTAVLTCVGLAGCTPANFIQRVRPAAPCNVQICTTTGAGEARCGCQTHEQTQRQIRETWGRQLG
jgi:hypothetical protein